MSIDDDLIGFSVAPKSDCPHITALTFTVNASLVPSQQTPPPSEKASARQLFDRHKACADCSDVSETWVCLHCTRNGCGRYVNGHMAAHATDQGQLATDGHVVIGFGLADLSAWCFACDAYITHPKLEAVFREMHFAKFGEWPPGAFHVDQAGSERHGIVLELGQ